MEWILAINAYYQISDIIKTGFKTQNQDTVAKLKKQLKDLEVTLNNPVKNFPEYLAYVRIEESYLNRGHGRVNLPINLLGRTSSRQIFRLDKRMAQLHDRPSGKQTANSTLSGLSLSSTTSQRNWK